MVVRRGFCHLSFITCLGDSVTKLAALVIQAWLGDAQSDGQGLVIDETFDYLNRFHRFNVLIHFNEGPIKKRGSNQALDGQDRT